jgi:transposase
MKHTTIAVDLAKSVFQVAVSHHPGHVAEEHRLSRGRFGRYMAGREPSVVLLEACGSAHHWARELGRSGHEVVLLPPHDVQPYVRRSKTDRNDARALLEAHRNQDIQPVPVKSVDQQTLGALHRLRSGWMATRTARMNAIRGHLREHGIVIPQGARHVVPRVHQLAASSSVDVPEPLRVVLVEMCREIGELEERIAAVERQLRILVRENVAVKQLMTVPGVGLLTATALVAFVGNVWRFRSGRHFASYLGLTPRERSSGGRRRLGRISKRGDSYLRTLLIHGARSVLWSAKRRQEPDGLRRWALEVERLRGHNKAAVALANKLARIIWVVWREQRSFAVERPAA